MTDQTIPPALTPEQWETPTSIGAFVSGTQFRCEVRGDEVTERPRHALAALCLYGQPFGFTRQDVRLLEWAVEYIGTPRHSNSRELPPFPPLYAGGDLKLRRLAAKIAALLPPEEASLTPPTRDALDKATILDAARYRKLRPHLRVVTLPGRVDASLGEVHRQLAFDMLLDYWGPEINARTVDEMLDLAPDQ